MSSGESNADESPDCDRVLTEQALDEISSQPIDDYVEMFATLGNETRYRILSILEAAEEPVCGCDLEPHLDVGQSSISQSLSRLRRAGLVSRTKDGRWRYYEPTRRGEQLVRLTEGRSETSLEATH